MAVDYQVVRFQKTATGGNGTTQDVSLNFTPKAIIVVSDNKTSDNTATNNYNYSYGFSDGTNHACISNSYVDNSGTDKNGRIHRNNAVWCRLFSSTSLTDPTEQARASVSFGTNKVTFTYDLQDAVATYITVIAFAGSDITNAKVATTTIGTTSTGTQNYTGLGFTPSDGLAALFTLAGDVTTANSLTTGSSVSHGVGVSSSKRGVIANVSEYDPGVRGDTWTYYNDARCLANLFTSSGSIDFLADFSSWVSDGFQLDIEDGAASASTLFSYLVINGGTWDAGSDTTQSGTTKNHSVSVSSKTLRGLGTLYSSYTGHSMSTSVQSDAAIASGFSDGSQEAFIAATAEDNQTTSDTTSINAASNLVIGISSSMPYASTTITGDFSSFGTNQFSITYNTHSPTETFSWWVVADGGESTTPITATRTHKYNIIGLLTATRTHKYNILQTITATRTHKYDITVVIAADALRTHKFNILELVSALKTHKFNIIGLVTALRTHKYNIQTLVSATRTHIYNILEAVSATKTHKYNILELVTALRTHKYDLEGKVTTTKTHKYNILELVTALRTHKFNLLQTTTATRTHLYNILEQITALRTHKYNLVELVTATRTHKFNILELVQALRTHKYNIQEGTQTVTATRTHKFNILALLTTTRTHLYNILELVSTTKTHKFNILELVQALRTHKYNLLEAITKTTTHKYNIIELLTALRTHKYHIEGLITTTRTHLYNILELVQATKTHKFNILEAATKTTTHKYNLIALVTALRTHKYHVEGLISATRTHLYNILNSVSTTKTHKFNIIETITKTTTHKYNIIELITALRTHKYHLEGLVTTTKTHLYNVLEAVSTTKTHLYNLLQAVTATKTHLYNILETLTTTKTHKFNLLQSVITTKTHKYNVGGTITATRTHKFNILETLTKTTTHKFTLLNSLTTTKTHKYNIASLVTTTKTHRYAMGGKITTTRTHKYNMSPIGLPEGSGGSTNVYYYFPRKPKEILDIIPADLENTVTANILVFEPYYRIFVDADIQYIQNVDNKQIARTASHLGLDVTDALGLQPNLLIASVQAGSGYQQENIVLAAVEQSSYVIQKIASITPNLTANIQLISKSNHSAKALIESCKDPIFTTSHIETTKSQYHSVINTKMMLTAEAERYQLLIKILQSEVFD